MTFPRPPLALRQSLSRMAALLSFVFALAASGASADPELVVMTYNLRYAGTQGPNAWPARRPLVKEVLEKYRPDLMGTQEGLYPQLKDIASDLPDYAWIGLGRDGGSHGEFMAIFYRRDRFEPLEYDHFWLSDTPEVIASSTWGNTNRRMVTWVRFRDRETNKEFYFWNTHLDHLLQPAREKGAQLIRQRVAALKTSLPVFLVGDFNAIAGNNPAYDLLIGEDAFQDTWRLAGERLNEDYNSFNGFRSAGREGKRIDWILARGPVSVRSTQVVIDSKDGRFPSDHFPVIARLTLP